MTDNDYIDLSLKENQNELAERISFFLTLEQLEKIDLTNVDFPETRDISEQCICLYSVDFEDSGIKMLVLDILRIDNSLNSRLTYVRVIQSSRFQMDFKCKYSENNIEYLGIMQGKAINFKLYRNSNENHIIKRSIIENYSRSISRITKIDELNQLKFVLDLIHNNNSIMTDLQYKYEYSYNGIKLSIYSIYSGIFKFVVHNQKSNKEFSIFLDRNNIGIEDMYVIIENALEFKK